MTGTTSTTSTPGASKPWSRRSPTDRPGPAGWDTIVIGSGMGGMTCAAMLAKLGQRVLVLEQHYVPGGFTHSFKRPGGYHWDVGVHAVGEVTERTLTGRLLRRLSDDRLQWASLGPSLRRVRLPRRDAHRVPRHPTKVPREPPGGLPRRAAGDRRLSATACARSPARCAATTSRACCPRAAASSPSACWRARPSRPSPSAPATSSTA
jgi:phytoene dehydrogenase-like protein